MILARLFACALVVAFSWLALMPDPAWAQKRGGTLVMLVQPEPPTLASYISTSGPIGQVATKVYEGLLEYDFTLKPIPGLADSWTMAPVFVNGSRWSSPRTDQLMDMATVEVKPGQARGALQGAAAARRRRRPARVGT